MSYPFDSLYAHGFARVSVAVPPVRVSDVSYNVDQTLRLARDADESGTMLTVFPELGLTAYTNDDLFQQDALLQAALVGLQRIMTESESLRSILLVGLPLRVESALYNCAAVVHGGRVHGIVPKSFIPNYREFYERRQFAPGRFATVSQVELFGSRVPFGPDLLFEVPSIPGFVVHAEICEDLWVTIPPSSSAALAGATVLTNLSASNVTIGKDDYRRSLGSQQSARCVAAYLYTAAGDGESTTDLAFDGDAHIHENGRLLVESERFSPEPQLISADIHLAALLQERSRLTSFADSAAMNAPVLSQTNAEVFRRIRVDAFPPKGALSLNRTIPRFPYVPSRADEREERCYEAYNIQVSGLASRLRAAGIDRPVIGISGGLDSTHALIVACRAMDRLGRPRSNVLAVTMPGFATSDRTLANARELMRTLGVEAREIDIRDSCMQMFRDIEHPFARGEALYDVTFENVQAGERTSHLFRLANLTGGMVVGTGDLSELALGWATYGVGDHMSHYAVNGSVPKTLIQYLIRWVAETDQMGSEVSTVLRDVLSTEISPELVPASSRDSNQPAQRSESVIGPYELQDFHLYYVSRYGVAPSSIVFLAEHAWSDADSGLWPDDIPAESRNAYDRSEIARWLRVFLARFFGSTQFKRSCIPNGPKVGSGGSLSPRGDWRAPSDSVPSVWLEELDRNVPRKQ